MSQSVQIFMSYAWKDNTLPPNDPSAKKGFVTALSEQLEYELEASDPKPILWRDRNKMDNAEQHDPIIEREIERSSLFLVVLSNHWLASDYCRKELKLFRQRWRHENDFDFGHRIILAHKTKVPREKRAEFFPNQLGFEFFRVLERDGLEIPFFHRGKGETEFFEQAVELGRILAKRSRNPKLIIDIDPPPPPPPAPPNAVKVYLAKPADDMLAAYERVHKELTDQGYDVLPKVASAMPVNASAMQFIDTALREARVSIHIIGRGSGHTPETLEPIVKLQLARAELRCSAATAEAGAEPSEFRRIVWIPKIFQDTEGNPIERDPLETFKSFGRDHRDDHIEGEDLSSFIVSLKQRLRTLRPLDGYGGKLKAGDKVYLSHHEVDSLYAAGVAEVLKQGNIGYVMSACCNASDAELKEFHREKLSECEAVMLCWAKASEPWARSQSNELEDWHKLGRKKEFSVRTLVAGPPPHIHKDDEFLRHIFPQTEIDVVVNWTGAEKPSLDAIAKIFAAASNPVQ
jgi:hypothetical protein